MITIITNHSEEMVLIRRWLATLIIAALLPTVAGCRGSTAAAKPLAPEVVARIQAPLDTATGSLRAMDEAAQTGDWAEVRRHYQTFRAAWAQIEPVLAGSTKQKLEDDVAELAEELDKAVPRQREIAEEAGKITRLLQTAVGGTPAQAVRGAQTIDVALHDYRFEPASITVPAGTRVTLRIQNATGQEHELELDAFDVEAEGIKPGATATLTFVADRPGSYEYACHLPGHYEAGMKGTLIIQPAG